jgi:hypothetical protein
VPLHKRRRNDERAERALLFLSCLLYTHSSAFDVIVDAKWHSSGAFARPAPSTASAPVCTAGILFDGSYIWFQTKHIGDIPVRCQFGIKPLQVLLATRYITFPFPSTAPTTPSQRQAQGELEGRFFAAVYHLSEILKSAEPTTAAKPMPEYHDLLHRHPTHGLESADFADGWIKRILAAILCTEISLAAPTAKPIPIQDITVDVGANMVAFLLPERAGPWLHLPLRRFLRDRRTLKEDWCASGPPRSISVEMARS